MSRVIHTGQALVDVVVEVPDLPARGQNVMAASATDYAGGAVTVLVAAARFGVPSSPPSSTKPSRSSSRPERWLAGRRSTPRGSRSPLPRWPSTTPVSAW